MARKCAGQQASFHLRGVCSSIKRITASKSYWLLDIEGVARFWKLEVHNIRQRLDKVLQGCNGSRRV